MKVGDAWLLSARAMRLSRRLSCQEYSIAHRFGAGDSHRDIAVQMRLAPATVRNVVQNIYRKLGINSKATLARMLIEEEVTGHFSAPGAQRQGGRAAFAGSHAPSSPGQHHRDLRDGAVRAAR